MAEETDIEGVKRASISMQPDVFDVLDRVVVGRGFQSRSQAIAELICEQANGSHATYGSEIVAGTITLFYDESRPGLQQLLATIQRKHIAEVISSQHVLLENNHTMEVLIVQGPADRLKAIADELIACRGVRSGHLIVSPALLPPIHN